MILKWYIGGEYFVTVRGKLVPLAVMMMMICQQITGTAWSKLRMAFRKCHKIKVEYIH